MTRPSTAGRAPAPLSRAQIERALRRLPGWAATDDRTTLVRSYVFDRLEPAWAALGLFALGARISGRPWSVLFRHKEMTVLLGCLPAPPAAGTLTRRDFTLAHSLEAWLGPFGVGEVAP
jgi:pterin-4a-carbinolamine dehydratase